MNAHRPGHGVTAILGPTNTGKTHLAIERMLAHPTGIIGLPLRLLAREVYDRIVALRGKADVALITGEEKINPTGARYHVCTVEAMPRGLEADFVAIDEIQLAADPERGHVFTDRLLNARGRHETLMLGAGTMHSMISTLLPGADFVSRPRFSKLSYAGRKKISRLPRRSAIVAFSTENVYAIAELIRRQRGGAAVVMGALSPRTRNAQVELFQSGDVDFLVATDAIGMGLNMDIDHVAFAGRSKFDGQRRRALSPAELAQIAGRAGRHMNDGTFGETADAPDFDMEVIERIESHEFERLNMLQWRNSQLDFASIDALRASLDRPADRPGLMRTTEGSDRLALEVLARDPAMARMAASPGAVRTLWDVCGLPDYRKIARADHARLIGRLFGFLSDQGRIPADWLEKKIAHADRTDGNIDTIASRIAYIRTWTFVANRSSWLEDAAAWREKTRSVEDKLSDALHERLTRRFVDRRTSVLMRRLREKEELMAVISDDGDVVVEGELVGRLKGFLFDPDNLSDDVHGKALRAAARSVLAGEIPQRAAKLAAADDSAFACGGDGVVSWNGAPVARLKAGDTALAPGLELIAGEELTGPDLELVGNRLRKWLADHITERLEPLVKLQGAEELAGLGRGLAFRLVENLGILPRDSVAEDVKALDQDERGKLRKYGVRFGAFSIFIPVLLKPAAVALRRLLWQVHSRPGEADTWPATPGEGLTSAQTDPAIPEELYRLSGFRLCGKRAVRIDMLERLADEIRPLVFWRPAQEGDARPEGSVPGGGFTVTPSMMSLVGCSGEEFAEILRTLGYRSQKKPAPAPAEPPAAAPETPATPSAPEAAAEAASPGADAGEPAAEAAASEAAEPSAAPEPGDAPATGEMATEAATEATSEAVTEAVAETVTEDAPAASSEAEAPVEPQFIEIWRPAPARRGGAPGGKKPPFRKGRKPDRKSEARHKQSGPKADKPKSKPKPIDPDSPFAALQALKKKMENQG